ncbi:ABC transporter ATP-binding protein [Streptomyces sp. NPDC051985]|uniref:ABC transporter ATP-binding protein n=1 Tax=Streptomyces sp. NPDC051985 TaxID=3155807 RepID=UPI0034473F59
MTVLRADQVTLTYRAGPTARPAVDAVSLEIPPGAAIGIAGESGSGKTSFARMLVGVVEPTSGTVTWDGAPLDRLPRHGPGSRARTVQMILQDPSGSLNPRMTVGAAVTEALRENAMPEAADSPAAVARLLLLVGLDPSYAVKYPFQLSGGERQRVSIARALAVEPRVLICDEVTSALDVSVQASILNLLRDLQRRTGMALVFVSHNLDVIRYLCRDVVVLLHGQVVERGPADRVLTTPEHAYTRQLVDAVPRLARPHTRA